MRTVRYTYRLRPGKVAERELLREWDRCRWVWNQSTAFLKNDGVWIKDSVLTVWRKEHGWLRDGSSVAQQQTIREFCQKRAKGKGKRKFKSAKRSLPSLNYTLRGFSIKNGKLRLAGGLTIPVVWSREFPSEPTSVRVYRDSIGHWYASFVVRRDDETLPDNPDTIGIDWGVREIATTTDPAYDLPHPEFGKRAQKTLTRYQRMMARRKPGPGQPGSKGYRQAKLKVAKQYKKVARQRQDTARKWATKVVNDHGGIAVEDFKPQFLAKSTMARKSADGIIGTTKRTLIEYAERAGRTVVMVPPAYTTMTCSGCQARAKQRLELSERVFVCPSCGLTEGRDRNAARVILARAGLNPADVDAVRHSGSSFPRDRVLAESGIPRL